MSISNDISIDNGVVLRAQIRGDLTLSGVISGAGNLNINGLIDSDTVTLTGNNTLTGNVILFDGILIAGHDNAIGTGNLQVTGNASLQSNDDSRTLSNNVTITNSDTLTISGSNNLTLSGVLSGAGSLTKSGTNTLTLSGINTYTGLTTVSAGTLLNSGTIAGSVTVGSGATLSGSGTISTNLINSGTLSPGTSPGTLTVGGDLTLNSAGTYNMEIADTGIAGTDYDLIDVTGAATIAGALNVIVFDTYTPTLGDTFTVIETDGGATGTFTTITDNLPAMFSIEQSISGNDLEIEIVAQPLGQAVTARNLVFAAEAFERIRNSSPTGDLATVIDQLETLQQRPLEIAFEQIVPNYLVTQSQATFRGIDVQNNNINGRLNELRYGLPNNISNNLSIQQPQTHSDPERELDIAAQANRQILQQAQEINRFSGSGSDIWGAWISGYGTFGNFDAALSQAGYAFDTGGATLGFDYRILDTLAAGAFAGYANTGTTVDGGQGSNYTNTVNTGIYMTWFNEEGFYTSGLVGGGVSFYENNRRIVFGNIDRVAESSATGFYVQALATGGYEFTSGNWGFGPQLALQYVNLQIGSHSESGADSLNLDVGAFQGNSFVTRLGFRVNYTYETEDLLLVPEVVGFWQHEYLSNFQVVNVGVPAGNQSFAYTGIGPSRDSGLLGVNLIGISHDMPLTFDVQYNVEFTPNQFLVNNFFVGIRVTF
ncbi:Extracellular serine protease precursor [Poriferisphaera corsica]|uniref:Extracellular serine protease n=1 Tax=Poriferisphaera corsica TaxID=2528020 RepID=A0A517YR97_9BACT|nr:autotransporter outer membrane beta-barrel domain-containing protein [Poriferisphaera corsica]QDU32711.1 Extracellular serine protease precursor [Poriferisphaera corsica]